MELTLWRESASTSGDDIPNIVQLQLPRNNRDDGAVWMYVPEKDTIYIGPPGSYHTDIANSLKGLVETKNPIFGVQYENGYADMFSPVDPKEEGRLLRALQMYHDENYSESFKEDNNSWDDSGGYYIEPGVHDYEDPDDDLDERSQGGLDSTNPLDFDTQAWGYGGKDDDEYKVMKPSPGAPKPIGQWDVQDYLDWRDKKYWSQGGYYATPREDYPHFRWSYGDSAIIPGCPHEGLWVWPTQNGYPDHFSQTGHKGLGNCAQGRIYPHVEDRWEILTWPQRPRNAPSEATRQYIQSEAEKAVKQYVMEKMGVPEDKIFFTNMHYSTAVSFYNSPSYPDDDPYELYKEWAPTEEKKYEWEPLKDWNSIPEGALNRIKDPGGTEWAKSGLEPDEPHHLRFYYLAGPKSTSNTLNIDPNTTPVDGWEFGKPIYDNEKSQPGLNPSNEAIEESYQKAKQQQFRLDVEDARQQKDIGKPGDKQTAPSESYLTTWHKSPDGTYSKIESFKTGPTLFSWDGTKYTYRHLTPEEAYEVRIRWHEEDEAKRKQVAQSIWPEVFNNVADSVRRTTDSFSEFNKGVRDNTGYDPDSDTYSFKDPNGTDLIHVTPQDYELAYRLHGDNWWKSFIPNRNITSNWQEVI